MHKGELNIQHMYHTEDYGENRVTKPYGTNNFFSYHFMGDGFSCFNTNC